MTEYTDSVELMRLISDQKNKAICSKTLFI